MKFLVLSVLVVASGFLIAEADKDFYTAAVFEHCRFGTRDDPPQLIVQTNLEYYRNATEVAKSKGADVIVFPEYGIFPPGERDQLKDYLESAPDPTVARVNPCEEPEAYSQKPILYTLSCMAKNNSIFVVSDTGDIQKCEGDPDCPSDGVFHFNTNVVFDRNGTLIVRYHKEHLFYEAGMDLARKQQNTIFETDFGTFATYICFDIDFARMSQVARLTEVDGIMFTTMWVEQPPQMKSVQVWESWSIGNNSTLIASNIQIPGFYALGSGIFHRNQGALAYTFNPDGISKLVVARVPTRGTESVPPEASITAITKNGTWEIKDDGIDVPKECSRMLLNETDEIYTEYRCVEENVTNYNFKRLEGSSGHVEACSNGLCCTLDYSADDLQERFFLGVFSGIYDHFGRYFWCEEDCILVRCEAYGDQPCATFPMKSNTVFRSIDLKANFSSQAVYPTVTQSGLRLMPTNKWLYQKHNENERSIHIENVSGENLITVGMKGRCYDRDPPYIR